MKNVLPILLLLFVSQLGISQITPIVEARDMGLGDFVTVSGTITTGSELGSIRFLQDGTAGIAAFSGNGSPVTGFTNLVPGDSVRVSGQLADFNGLLQISPITNYTVLAGDRPLPAPTELSPDQWNDDTEGLLIQTSCVELLETGLFDDGVLPFVTAAGDDGVLYIRNGHPIIGSVIPNGNLTVSGVLTEYQGLYEILPRSVADFQPTNCNLGISNLTQTNIAPNGFTLSWTTPEPFVTSLQFGADADNLDQTYNFDDPDTEFSVDLTGLEPATFYYGRLTVSDGTEALTGPVRTFITKSTSSGLIEVYFNSAVLVNPGNEPAGTSVDETEARMLRLIDEAQQTIDVAAYNTTRTSFVQALKDAHNRGVRVRYMRDDETGNQGLSPPPAFPVLVASPGDPLMHNKFLVIDADLPDAAYLWTGSMNFTNSNVARSFNNSVLVQDQSLVRTYELEFEEMWGSDGAQFDEDKAKYGSAKRDNTPHHFLIGDVPVECYFSPTDRTTDVIERTLRTADQSIDAALLLLTRDDLTDALADAHQDNLDVRLMIDDVTDDYQYLTNLGVPTIAWPSGGKFLHHKYAIVDADAPASDPVVITGSHNWTNKAETTNDENTLLLFDADLADQFRQEYESRWNFFTDTEEIREELSEFSVRPNPAVSEITLQFPGVETRLVRVTNALGEEVFRGVRAPQSTLLVVDWTPGVYFVVAGSRVVRLVVGR